MSDSATTHPKFVFFGTPEIAVTALEEMASFGCLPSLIVTNPDALVGRKQLLTPPPVKVWAEAHQIPVLQPSSLKNPEELTALTDQTWDFFTVFAYGKIIPAWLLDIPTYGTINAHPSLLPKFRGASPIRSTLLSDLSAAGVTIIEMDAELDHGPILAQVPIPLAEPIPGRLLDTTAGRMCGDLLVQVMRELPQGTITLAPQDHSAATYSTKLTKAMSELALDPHQLPGGEEAFTLYRKICAFDGWPGTYFMYHDTRITINEAKLAADGTLEIMSITPAGKKQQPFNQWLQNQTPT